MIDRREKFRQLTQVFDPIYRPYQDAEDGPGASYVSEAHEDYRKQIKGALDLNDNAKLLVAGQLGCGKTTLLLSVAQQMRSEGRIVAFVDLVPQTAVRDLDAVEMHLAAMAALLTQARDATASLSPGTVKACQAWLAQLEGPQSPPDPEAIATALTRHLARARESDEIRRELRDRATQGGADQTLELLAMVLQDLSDRRPVVILDGLDKLPPVQARDTFLNHKRKPMAEAPGSAILTIPLSLVYEPTFNVLSGRYNNAHGAVLPAVRLWHFDPATGVRQRSEEGVRILRKIVEARINSIGPRIVMNDAIDCAIHGTAGNIRELSRLMQSSVVKAYVRDSQYVEPRDVEVAIADQRESFRRSYDPRFLPILKQVRDECRLAGASDVIVQLLYGLWVLEYRNGTTWYSLPRPVEQLLHQMELG